jgi:pulcherriminic acid synthase
MRNIIEFDVMDPIFQRDPIPMYERLHAADAIFLDPKLDAYFLGRHDDVTLALRSPAFTTTPLAESAQPVMGDRVLAQMEGQEHKSKRRLVLSAFSGRQNRERHSHIIARITSDLLSDPLRLGRVDLISDFGKTYSMLVTLEVLGLPTDRYRDVIAWHEGVASFITSLRVTEAQRKHSLACSRAFIAYLTPLITDLRSGSGEGLIPLLCNPGRGEAGMTASEIVALVLNVVLAAAEPTDKTLAYLFYHLTSCPVRLETVRENRQLLALAIAETLRLNAPVQLIPRQLNEEVTVGGRTLPAGARVFCMPGAANRDPSVFFEPARFDIDRRQSTTAVPGNASTHLAFGAGAHVCLGAAFSHNQLELTANILLDRLRGLRISPHFTLQEEGFYTRGPVASPLEFQPYPDADTDRPRE